MLIQIPTIGCAVHYTNLGDADGKSPPSVQYAVVTGVYREVRKLVDTVQGYPLRYEIVNEPANGIGEVADSDVVDLHIFYRTGQFDMQRVPFAETPTRGHWNWPPRIGC